MLPRAGPIASRPPADGRTSSLGARLAAWRTRLVGDPAFQRWAARFLPTRGLARRRSAALFRITAGFAYTQVLAACVALDLFGQLAGGPRSEAALAAATGVPRRRLQQLLAAAQALELIRAGRDGTWALADFGAVVAGNPGIRAMIGHHAMLYRDLADPVALLRGEAGETETARFWAYAGRREAADTAVDDDAAAAYSRLMRASQDLVTAEVLDAYPLGRHRVLLDVGGGDGAFLAAAGRRHSRLALRLFDLPAVAGRAKARLAAAGLAARSTVTGGNFFTDPLPGGADLVTLVRVLCDHEDEAALALLGNVRAAMRGGDTLLVAEPMAAGRGEGDALAAAYFSVYFLAMGAGRNRSPQALIALLRQAGFASAQLRATRNPLFARLIVARA